MLEAESRIFQFLHELGELVGDGDSKDGNEGGIEEEREEAAVGEIRLDVIIDELLDDVVPGKRRDQAKTTRSKRDHLLENFLVQFFLL